MAIINVDPMTLPFADHLSARPAGVAPRYYVPSIAERYIF
jgi:hypothetical protein